MRKVFSTHSECAHVWAQQKQSEGKSGSIFFDGTKIYSYGRHYVIANFVTPQIVLINSNGYSNSTSKHHNHVQRALHGVNTFHVPYVDYPRHDLNIKHYKDLIDSNMSKALTATKSTNWLISNAMGIYNTMQDYCNAFSIVNTELPPIITPELQARIDRQEAKVKEQQIKKELEEKELFNNIYTHVLPAWINHERPEDFYNFGSVRSLKESYLRLSSGEIETSHGAKVPLNVAKVLFDRIKEGKDIRGFEIGNYTVIGINGVLTVGCHKIERSEINRFAELMNWGSI